MWHDADGMGWWMVFTAILFTIFWISVIWLFLQGGRSGDRPAMADDSPLEIVRRRYARGEITKAQYEELRRDLT